jgi:DNA-binding response OmpR family regulator
MPQLFNMKKVLVIDDDPDIVDAVTMILSDYRYESKGVTAAREAYQYANNYQPDVIILDYLLSGTDGSKICKQLKTDSRTKDIPIIMMSAHPSAQEYAKDCGADSFVYKPFSIDEVLEKLNKLTN